MPPMTTDRGGRRADGTGVSQPRVRMAVALLALAVRLRRSRDAI